MHMNGSRALRGLALGAVLAATAAAAQNAPFGTDTDAGYAAGLYQAMVEADLVGDGMIRTTPYEGTRPHGRMLETIYTEVEVDGHEGRLIVKRNFGPEGITADEVLADPAMHLASTTVMFRREDGYDPDNADWFWAKYRPDGTLSRNPQDRRLAGRVAKGADRGCIACHSDAPGDDYLYTTDFIGE